MRLPFLFILASLLQYGCGSTPTGPRFQPPSVAPHDKGVLYLTLQKPFAGDEQAVYINSQRVGEFESTDQYMRIVLEPGTHSVMVFHPDSTRLGTPTRTVLKVLKGRNYFLLASYYSESRLLNREQAMMYFEGTSLFDGDIAATRSPHR